MNVKFNEDTIRVIILFENVSGSSVKDCVAGKDGTIYIIVEEGKLGAAIGKGGKNIKLVERIIGKKIKLFEFSRDINTFAKMLIPQANRIDLVESRLEVWVDRKYRAVVIGRDRENLNLLKSIFQRNFDIKDLVIR